MEATPVEETRQFVGLGEPLENKDALVLHRQPPFGVDGGGERLLGGVAERPVALLRQPLKAVHEPGNTGKATPSRFRSRLPRCGIKS